MYLTFEAFRELLRLEYPLRRNNFAAIYDRVRKTSVGVRRPTSPDAPEICRAVDAAAALYLHRVLCLQRSAATVRLLRKHGFPARMVIGVQQLPFAVHAWAELDGTVINDKPYIPEMYSVLDRC